MSRDELIALGKRIVASGVTEAELAELADLFHRNVPHPKGATLFFYPDNYNARLDDISKYNPSIEDVVDLCLAYKPIQL